MQFSMGQGAANILYRRKRVNHIAQRGEFYDEDFHIFDTRL
jgi:hypothetical protein